MPPDKQLSSMMSPKAEYHSLHPATHRVQQLTETKRWDTQSWPSTDNIIVCSLRCRRIFLGLLIAFLQCSSSVSTENRGQNSLQLFKLSQCIVLLLPHIVQIPQCIGQIADCPVSFPTQVIAQSPREEISRY